MAVNPFLSAQRLQTAFLDASPFRYSRQDTGAEANLNRTVGWFGHFVPWVAIPGDRLDVLGHDILSNGRDSEFYDLLSTAPVPPPIGAATQYQTADPDDPAQLQVSYTVLLKQLAADIVVRDFTALAQSEFYDQTDFQRLAAQLAIKARWERAAVLGNATANPEQFDGLAQLVANNHGSVLPATLGQELEDLDRAMTQVIAHGRRVDLIVMNQTAWLKLLFLQRERGFRPETRHSDVLGFEISYYNGVPVCLSDHIPNRTPDDRVKTSVFVMTLGEPNGVFAIVNRKAPGIIYPGTHVPQRPFTDITAEFFSALVSATSDALVQITGWDATIGTPPT